MGVELLGKKNGNNQQLHGYPYLVKINKHTVSIH